MSSRARAEGFVDSKELTLEENHGYCHTFDDNRGICFAG
jgi:hypothetical protein